MRKIECVACDSQIIFCDKCILVFLHHAQYSETGPTCATLPCLHNRGYILSSTVDIYTGLQYLHLKFSHSASLLQTDYVHIHCCNIWLSDKCYEILSDLSNKKTYQN